MASQLVLVTGISEFLGAHVLDKLVKEGYKVRGFVRTAKVAKYQAIFAHHGAHVDIVGIDDLPHDDFTSAMEDVHAVIHTVFPMPDYASPEEMLDVAEYGTLNVIRQAQKAGVKHFSVISSLLAVSAPEDPKDSLTEDQWLGSTRESALASKDLTYRYCASKELSEKALWKFADEHPDLNITTINPPHFLGPWAPGAVGELSTNWLLYNNVYSRASTPYYGYIDVRDVAQAMVAGIKVKGKNRVLIIGEWFDHSDAVEYLEKTRPELKDRLPTLNHSGRTKAPTDNARAIQILGVPPARSWKDTMDAAVDALLSVEKEWAAARVFIL